MASLVVAGDVSGSVTLSAPSAAGSTVITLPTTSGTMVVTGGAQTVQFAAGSAASPSITFTGDTNTGIFSPAADTIGFSEGGVESMRIDASGNVGIGTTAPSSSAGKLVVSGVANVYGDERKILNLIDTTALATGVGAGISFWGTSESGGGASQFGSIKGVKENATSANYAGALAFVTSNSSNVQREQVRITSGGDLFIKNNSNLQWSEYSAGTSGVIWTGHGTNNTLDAYTTGTLRMRIASDGLVSTTGSILSGGYVAGAGYYRSSGMVNETVTVTTAATVYGINKDSGAGGSSSTSTYNITGVPNQDGAFLFLYVRCSNTAPGINTVVIVTVHGSAELFRNSVQNTTKTGSVMLARQNGSWYVVAPYHTGAAISI